MAQNSTYNIPNTVGATFRSNINSALGDVVTTNSGTTAPVGIEVNIGMLWYNSSASTVSGIAAGTVGVCTAVTNQGTETGAGTWAAVGTAGAITEAFFTTVFGSSKDLGDVTSTYTAASDTLDLNLEADSVDIDELNATAPTTGQILTADSATAFSWADAAASGTDIEFETWRLNSLITGESNPIANSKWSRSVRTEDLMTQSSTDVDHFIFPSTGYWLVKAGWEVTGRSAQSPRFYIQRSSTGSSGNFNVEMELQGGQSGTSNTRKTFFGELLVDVTSTTNVLVNFSLIGGGGSTTTHEGGSVNMTYVEFMKLGET